MRNGRNRQYLLKLLLRSSNYLVGSHFLKANHVAKADVSGEKERIILPQEKAAKRGNKKLVRALQPFLIYRFLSSYFCPFNLLTEQVGSFCAVEYTVFWIFLIAFLWCLLYSSLSPVLLKHVIKSGNIIRKRSKLRPKLTRYLFHCISHSKD